MKNSQMFRGRLVFAKHSTTYVNVALIFLFLTHHICSASKSNYCNSSCGNLRISFPLRLKSDPRNCGDKRYELVCEDSITTLYSDSGKYNVQAINYNNATIRLVDANVEKNNCSSIPLHSVIKSHHFSFPDFDDGRYWWAEFGFGYPYLENLYQSLVFIKCEIPVNSPLYLDRSICNNNSHLLEGGSGFSYALIAPSINATELVDSCLIESMALTSLLLPKDDVHNNISYLKIHESLVYGFELSWFWACCRNRCSNHYGLPSENGCPYNSVVYIVAEYLAICIQKLLQPFGFGDSYVLYEPLNLIYSKIPNWLLYSLRLIYELIILAMLYRVAIFICGAPCVIAFLIYKWRRRHLSIFNNIEEFLQSHNNLMPIRYSYSEIKRITHNFKDKLGEGGFASVYKGKLRSGNFAAIKMLDKSKSDGKDFISEVATIGKIHHVNIVRLIGFCVKGSKRALVYDFMVNGSLDKYIFSQESNMLLNNEKMYEISLGVGRGIEYLHRGCGMQILHFDIKPHNILLDENFIPKISDFGLAKLYPTNNNTVSLTAARGTMGYMAPELCYKNIGSVSYKADVYSFGMLLMEMAGRRKNLNAFSEHLSQIYLPSWAYEQYYKGKSIESGEVTEGDRKITKKMILVALWCIQMNPTDRPPMHKVIEMLEGDVERIIMPPKPSFSVQKIVQDDARINENSTELTSLQSDSESISLVLNAN